MSVGKPIALDRATITRGGEPVLSDLTATFVPGTVTALVGGDGAGKTSLLAKLAHPVARKRLGVTHLAAGDVTYQGAAGGVWQNLSVAENLEFVALTYGLGDARARIGRLLDDASLTDARNRTGAHLSGGMRQKLGTIMAMLPDPGLLLLDEPTTGVDPDSRATIWRLIRDAAAGGATVILSTTYLDEAAGADQVLVLDDATVLAAGSPTDVIRAMPGYITAKDADGTVATGAATWRRADTAYTWHESAPDGRPLGPEELDLELAVIGMLLEAGGAGDDDDLPDIAAQLTGDGPLVSAEGLVKRFGSFTALDSVDLAVAAGEIVGLIGGNGAGKSTLIRMVLGLDEVDGGVVTLLGGPPNRTARRDIGYVPQSLGLYPTLSPRANYRFTTGIYGADGPEPDLDDRTPTGRLPLGAQRNLAVTCALAHQPRLLILDEPTSGMDALSRARLWKVLRVAADGGVGILITTHYMDEARQCDRLVHLEAGREVG